MQKKGVGEKPQVQKADPSYRDGSALERRAGLAALALRAFAAVDVIAVGAVTMPALAALQFVNPMTATAAGLPSVADNFLIARIDVARFGRSLVREHAVLLGFGAHALGNSGHGGCE